MENFFTIVGENNLDSLPVGILRFSDQNPEGIDISINGNPSVRIGNQQLMEIGALFIALAGQDVDQDSAIELIEGFNLSMQPIYDFNAVVST